MTKLNETVNFDNSLKSVSNSFMVSIEKYFEKILSSKPFKTSQFSQIKSSSMKKFDSEDDKSNSSKNCKSSSSNRSSNSNSSISSNSENSQISLRGNDENGGNNNNGGNVGNGGNDGIINENEDDNSDNPLQRNCQEVQNNFLSNWKVFN